MNKLLPTLKVNNVDKIYPLGKSALKGIDFTAYKGEIIGLIGHNGAGKSSLIHVISGVLRPTSGKIEIYINNPNKLAWVSQQTIVDWYLNVLDNVILGARLGGLDKKAGYSKALECISLLELSNEIYCPVDSLSGGQLKRVQIARALAQLPEILILDEPTISLDPKACIKLMSVLKDMAKLGCLVIISSHDLNLLENNVHRILFLKEGKLIVDDELSTFIKTHESCVEIEIIYKGKISKRLIQELKKSVRINAYKPLKLRVPSSLTIGKIIKSLLNEIEIIDISKISTGLKEVYINY